MSTEVKRLYRSKTERMLNGVCGGLGEYFNIDPTVIRLIFVALGFFTGPIIVIVYLIMVVVIPEAPDGAVDTYLEMHDAPEEEDSDQE